MGAKSFRDYKKPWVKGLASDYLTLLKPRVMSLVIFTAFIGMMLAPELKTQPMHWLDKVVAILCISLGAGASGAINMWYDRDIDAVMMRTQSRPIPKERIPPLHALIFGGSLSLLSVGLMAYFIHWPAAFLLLLTIVYYDVIYTMWLKRLTPQNIVIGGAAGAFPPVIGWVAVTGTFDLQPWWMFLIIFLWTPPHFWALSLQQSKDYSRANVPMMPLVKGVPYTKKLIFQYTLLLWIVSLGPAVFGPLGYFYVLMASLLGGIFCYRAAVLCIEKGTSSALGLFKYSLFYLATLFLSILLDHYVV